jgi:hypothetical protein
MYGQRTLQDYASEEHILVDLMESVQPVPRAQEPYRKIVWVGSGGVAELLFHLPMRPRGTEERQADRLDWMDSIQSVLMDWIRGKTDGSGVM